MSFERTPDPNNLLKTIATGSRVVLTVPGAPYSIEVIGEPAGSEARIGTYEMLNGEPTVVEPAWEDSAGCVHLRETSVGMVSSYAISLDPNVSTPTRVQLRLPSNVPMVVTATTPGPEHLTVDGLDEAELSVAASVQTILTGSPKGKLILHDTRGMFIVFSDIDAVTYLPDGDGGIGRVRGQCGEKTVHRETPLEMSALQTRETGLSDSLSR